MAAKVGYCGLDRHREPLVGDEIRACWEPGGATAEATASPVLAHFGPGVTADGKRDFVEVGAVGQGGPSAPVTSDDESDPVEPLFELPAAGATGGEPRWSLWSDLEA